MMAYSFIGSQLFTEGVSDQFRAFVKNGLTIIQYRSSDNGAADFSIALQGAYTLTANDFSF